MTTTIEPTLHTNGLRERRGVLPAVATHDGIVHIADPAPLGLAAFAGTTFVLSLFNAGLVGNAALVAVVLPIALLYGGLAQLLAGMWEFRKNNTFGAVAFTSYGAFWISYFVYARYIAGTLPPADAHTATGIFLLMWTIFTAYMMLAAVKTNPVLLAVFGTVLVTFTLLTVGEFAESTTLLHSGGFVGLVAAALAWYASAAGVVNATWSRSVLPMSLIKHG
jgi:succinate-acetate transporter protein